MWHVEKLNDEHIQFCRLCRQAGSLSYADALTLWETDSSFRDAFIQTLAACPFSGFRWETPAMTNETLDRPFEFVLLQADSLQRPVDPTAFASHFAADDRQSVFAFPNLRGDATMIVPAPTGEQTAYGHLASFVRNAPSEQVHELWQVVGRTVREQVSDKPIWLSTAGMGVSWLHIRDRLASEVLRSSAVYAA